MKKSLTPATLFYPTPVLLIGTYDSLGKPNLMCASWGGVCASNPPMVCVSLRKATYSHASIIARKAFTVGFAHEKQIQQVKFIGSTSGRNIDKFAQTGFTARRSEKVDAPYADEIPHVLECVVRDMQERGSHTQFIAEIVGVLSEESLIDEKNSPAPLQMTPLVYVPGRKEYFGLRQL